MSIFISTLTRRSGKRAIFRGSLSAFKDIRKILVIKLKHIGDVLLAVPAIRALKKNFPDAEVSALVNSGTEEMLTLNPLLGRVMTFDRHTLKLPLAKRAAGELGFIKRLRRERFDMTVDLTSGDRPSLIGFLSGARYRLGYDPGKKGFKGKRLLYTHLAAQPDGSLHTVLRDLRLVEEFGITANGLAVDIYTSAKDDTFVEALLKGRGIEKGGPYAHIHPASRWLFKCWTDDGMAYVIDRLESAGIRTVLTSGPEAQEVKKVKAIVSKAKGAPIDLSGRLSLKQLASLSRRALFFFGVDTAPMHIAAATNAKVIAIFGPSGSFNWGPWDNDWATSHKKAGLAPYPKRSGIQRFGKNIVIQDGRDCVPCGKDGCKGSKKSDCLDELSPVLVWDIIAKELELMRT